MNLLQRNLSAYLLYIAAAATVFLSGCTAHNPNVNTKNFQNNSFIQKMKKNPGNKLTSRSTTSGPRQVPEMTNADFERLGDDLFARGELLKAFVQYEKCLRLNPKNIRVLYKKGLLFVAANRNQEAIRQFRAVLEKDNGYALAYQGLGQAYFQRKEYEEAEIHFAKAVELNYKLWKAHNYLGIIYDYRKEYTKAVRQYAAAIAINPELGLIYHNLGVSYCLAGDYRSAIAAFQKALDLNHTTGKTYNNLGIAFAKTGQYQNSLQTFMKAGNKAKAYNNLGCIYLTEGKYEKAIACFEKAIELNPTFYDRARENLTKVQMVQRTY